MTEAEIGVKHVADRGRALSRGAQVALEAEKSKEVDSSFGANRRDQLCQHLDFYPLRLILNFWPSEL